MTAEVIEGEAIEVEPRALTVVAAQPGQSLVADTGKSGPADMIEKASAIATALRDIVERQRLYAVISGKKYPQVEAWSTIGRMDNVVAREASRPIRHDDGSYEAEVELVRLSDGMVIGRASALCGMPDDRPWATRAEYARRSMAVTRATSRAFRQQYSWIMALAGYEPTPADEMPQDSRDVTPRDPTTTHDDGLVGTAEVGKADADFELRQTPDGDRLAFRLTQGRKGYKVIATGLLAGAIATLRPSIEGQRVTVWGTFHDETFTPKPKDGETPRDVTYQVVHLERIATPDGVLPAPLDPPPAGVEAQSEAESEAMFDPAESARLDTEAVA
jgi:hypothetical protein